MKKRFLALVLALTLSVGLIACGETPPAADPTPSTNKTEDTATAKPTPETTPETTPEVTVRFGCLSGPTGVGAVKLMADAEAGTTLNDYEVTIAAENTEIAGKLTNGDIDIACIASNVAANLYNKTEGDIQALCLSTLGVLYILERGEKGFTPTITSMADLKGKTIVANGQGANPEYVLDYLLSANGVNPDTDVEIIWKATGPEVMAEMVTGDAQIAMLPMPVAAAAQIQAKQTEDREVKSVLSLTDEWNKVTEDSVLTMTTVVVRTEFAQEHPEAVANFLQEYAASIEYVNTNVEDAAALVEQYGIVAKAAIAKAAIPACNLVFIDGADMMNQITGYYEVLYNANPTSIGGKVPDSAFYYGVN